MRVKWWVGGAVKIHQEELEMLQSRVEHSMPSGECSEYGKVEYGCAECGDSIVSAEGLAFHYAYLHRSGLDGELYMGDEFIVNGVMIRCPWCRELVHSSGEETIWCDVDEEFYRHLQACVLYLAWCVRGVK